MDKNIKKKYGQLYDRVLNDKNECTKKEYVIIFRELDKILNKELLASFENNLTPGKHLIEEVKRVRNVMALYKHRLVWREKMITDFKNIMGYEPVEMGLIPFEEEIEDYEGYAHNLEVASKIIKELIKSGKKLTSLKTNIQKRKSSSNLKIELDRLQEKRAELLNGLKSNFMMLEDLYDYCITAPFNEENAYIQYILIKFNPNEKFKNDISAAPKRAIRKREKKETDIKPATKMPVIASIGSVQPNRIITEFKEAKENFTDVVIPTHGVISGNENITVSDEDIK